MHHIALIMDGNGRWAEKRGLDRLNGHAAGADAVLKAINAASTHNIKYLTLYSFSTENFNRSKSEVYGIFGIMADFLLDKLLPLCVEKNFRVRFIGQLELLPLDLLDSVNIINKATLNNSGMCIIIALAYGGREEITNAINAIIKERFIFGNDSELCYNDIKRYLYTSNVDDPELIIRYGGHQRLSNLYPLQSVYSELMFTPKLWPDFEEADLTDFIQKFKIIKRNFGENK